MFRVACVAWLLLAQVARAEDFKALTDPLVKPVLDGHKNVGLIVGIRRGGQSLVYGYGKVSTATGRRVPDGRTVFEIGSITKPFTGVLLAEAIRRDEVKLDDPITKHLPAEIPFKPHPDGVPTLLDFATHRSGLPVQPPLIGLLAPNPANPYAGFDRKLLSQTMAILPPTHAPGKVHTYSNLAAGLLGHALVNAAKADSYGELVRQRITKPLRMTDTTDALNGEQRARLARGHDADGEVTDPWDFASLEACGCLRSTADDLLLFAAANLNENSTPLTASLTMAREARRGGGAGSKVGFFWVTKTFPKSAVETVWHNGGTGGYRTMMMLAPKTKTAVVVLCAADRGDVIDKLAIDLMCALHAKD